MARVHKLFPVLIAGAAVLFSATSAGATSIMNADFSGGNVGFSSGYVFDQANLLPPGTYYVGTDPASYNPLWGNFGDHTTGTGSMLIVNGATVAGASVWSENLNVDQRTSYTFSVWVASAFAANPAELAFLIDGSPIGSPFTASSTVGEWTRFEADWNAGMATNVTLGLVDLNTMFHGNDFALDDFDVTDPPPPPDVVPEPATLTLLGLGFATAAMTRRRR
jgi:hypothetical protein